MHPCDDLQGRSGCWLPPEHGHWWACERVWRPGLIGWSCRPQRRSLPSLHRLTSSSSSVHNALCSVLWPQHVCHEARWQAGRTARVASWQRTSVSCGVADQRTGPIRCFTICCVFVLSPQIERLPSGWRSCSACSTSRRPTRLFYGGTCVPRIGPMRLCWCRGRWSSPSEAGLREGGGVLTACLQVPCGWRRVAVGKFACQASKQPVCS